MMEWQTLIDNSVMGVLLAWFMFRMERVVKNNTEVLFSVKERIGDTNGRRRK